MLENKTDKNPVKIPRKNIEKFQKMFSR